MERAVGVDADRRRTFCGAQSAGRDQRAQLAVDQERAARGRAAGGALCRRAQGEASRSFYPDWVRKRLAGPAFAAPRWLGGSAADRLRRPRAASMKLHEFQAKQVLGRFGVAVPTGCRVHFTRGRGRGPRATGDARHGRQGPDPRRGARQGRRRPGRAQRRRGPRGRRVDPRSRVGHPPDRTRGPARAAPVGRAGLRHRGRVLPRDRRRPQYAVAGHDGLLRGRHGDRRGRGQDAPTRS